jgi:hypothetical protein
MSPPYRVVYPESVQAALRTLYARAAGQNRAHNFLNALRAIDNRLRLEARTFGEPKHRYQALKLELRVAIEPPLVVRYTVHDEEPVVFVKSVDILPGQPF